MSNKDKEAFDKWAGRIEVEWGIDGKKVTLFNRIDMEECWQSACEYKQKEYENIKRKIDLVLFIMKDNEWHHEESQIEYQVYKILENALKNNLD